MIYFPFANQEEARQRAVGRRHYRLLRVRTRQGIGVGMLAYGLRKRVELGRALALEPRILLSMNRCRDESG